MPAYSHDFNIYKIYKRYFSLVVQGFTGLSGFFTCIIIPKIVLIITPTYHNVIGVIIKVTKISIIAISHQTQKIANNIYITASNKTVTITTAIRQKLHNTITILAKKITIATVLRQLFYFANATVGLFTVRVKKILIIANPLVAAFEILWTYDTATNHQLSDFDSQTLSDMYYK